MKKILLLMAAVLLINIPIFAQGYDDDDFKDSGGGDRLGDIELHLNFFSVGLGLHTGHWAGEGYLEVLRFGFEHKVIGIGAGFTPFHFYGILGGNYDDNGNVKTGDDSVSWGGGASFINLNTYWNLFRLLRIEGFGLGPFFDLNWLIVHTGDPNPAECMFTLGVQAGIRKGRVLKSTVFSVEIGARWIYNYSGKTVMDDATRLYIALKAGR